MKTKKITIEQFESFLQYTYSQLTGNHFVSVKSYLGYLNKAIKHAGTDKVKFFNSSLLDIKILERKIIDNPAFQSLAPKYQSDIRSGYHAFILFLRYLNGYVTLNNNSQC